jgi:hypothetical protein
MASIQKLPHSPNWIAYYRTADGKLKAKSTGMPATAASKVKAMRFADGLEQATRDVRMIGHLRKLVSELAQEAGEEARQPSTIREWCKAWIDGKRSAVEPSTLASIASPSTASLRGWGAIPRGT